MNDKTTALELRAGPLRLALRPDLGGCIAGLWHRHLPVLRCTEPGELDGAAGDFERSWSFHGSGGSLGG